MPANLPNALTALRIALIPILVAVFYAPTPLAHAASALVFAAAAVTDWLDGYLARRFDQITAFGAFLDPVADKLMVAVALVLVLQAHPSPLLAIACAVIIGREIAVSALREWMAELGDRARVAVSWVGKLKTTVQMLAILLLLYATPIAGLPIWEIGMAGLLLAAVLTLWSMLDYLRAAWPLLRGEDADGARRVTEAPRSAEPPANPLRNP